MRWWSGRKSRSLSRARRTALGPPGPEHLSLEGDLSDDVFEHRHADPRSGRHAHGAVALDDERLADDLGREVASRRGDVTGQAEVRQRREVHVVRAADAHLEHAAAPDRHVVRGGHVVHRLRGGETADATGLDVDDLRRTDRDRLPRVFGRVDRLVQADRGAYLLRELGVVDDVVVRERLFDHYRGSRVDALEQLDVVERVRRVRVEHEREVGERLARRLCDLDLETRLDLELHALVPTRELAADRLHERIDRRLDPDRDTAEDPVARAAEERRERLLRTLREEVPDRHLGGRLRHAVLADPAERAVNVLRPRDLRFEELRQDELLERVEDRAGRLSRIPRALARDALAPADGALRLDAA